MTDDLEADLRQELRSRLVPFQESRVAEMIEAATALALPVHRRWAAPAAAAAAVAVVGGGAAWFATGSSSHSDRVPAGGGRDLPEDRHRACVRAALDAEHRRAHPFRRTAPVGFGGAADAGEHGARRDRRSWTAAARSR